MDSVSIELIIASFEKHLDKANQQQLNAWLKESEQNREKYEELKKIYNSSGKLKVNFNPDPQTALKQTNRKLLFRKSIRRVQRIAAVLIIGAISTLAYLQISAPHQLQELTAHERMAIILPDSSKVILDKDASIQYPEKFGKKKRNIKVSGNAYFEVRHNVKAPFIVSATHTQITVLGTKFLIKANAGNESVIVDEGKVAFNPLGAKKSQVLILTKQQSGVWNSGNQSIKKIQLNETNSNAWLSGRLAFNDTPLQKVIKDLREHYKVTIELDGQYPLPLKYTGIFNQQTLDEILEIICLSLNLNYEKTENSYKIKP